ncbi:substrate-binding domain-containing protein [Roseicella sp. DB1501]|uniref:substrate-binding domain-containing protein n=1 Tax=Roseicella sp. DB1501 TaxID=2730925 RepID=UPI001491A9F2|nr:substrate-binding domain-containing protein [Roseicella sp. DB1501]NOG71000.1 solute-binding protein [Roseicella sp. DB1501]
MRRLVPGRRLLLGLSPLLLAAGGEPAIRLLSAGAVEPGIAAAVAAFRAQTGRAVQIAYATAPQLRERMLAGERPDLLVAPAALLDSLGDRLAGPALPLGRVGIGVVVRRGAPAPAIRDAATLRAAVESADAVVFNRASTGLAMERLFARLGLAALLAEKARRYATGAEVMQHLLQGDGAELGFGATTEIAQVPALQALGPLPDALQSYTAYGAAALPDGAGEALLQFLAGSEARRAFTASGIEP